MLLQIENTQFQIDFNNGIYAKPIGSNISFYFEVTEYVKNNPTPKVVESYYVHTNPQLSNIQEFKLPIQFYFDFELSIYKFVNDYGLKRIYSHRFNDTDKIVKFILKPKNLDEGFLWMKKIDLYCSIHSCKKIIESDFKELNQFSDDRFYNKEIEPYKTYRIGRHPKNSTDFRTLDVRKEGVIWFGNWKTFWSYEHPRSWNFLSSEEIINDILGFE